MLKRNSIVHIPLLAAIVLSIAVHVAALYSRGIYTPPKPRLESGRTVVQLTLVPTVATQAAAPEPEPPEPQPEKLEPIEPNIIDIPIPVIAVPEPTPTLETVPAPEVAPTPETTTDSASEESMEQNASLQEDKGVTAEATVSGSFRPPYPRISQRRDETGTVKLSVQVLADGTAGAVEVIQSSGHHRLDEAAVKGAKKTEFNPAQQFGKKVETTIPLDFTFNLTDD